MPATLGGAPSARCPRSLLRDRPAPSHTATVAAITEADVLAALDRPMTAMELSERFPGPAVWNYQTVRERLLSLERRGLVHRVPAQRRRDQRWTRAA